MSNMNTHYSYPTVIATHGRNNKIDTTRVSYGYKVDGRVVKFAVAYTSFNDRFKKKDGREIVDERLQNHETSHTLICSDDMHDGHIREFIEKQLVSSWMRPAFWTSAAVLK